MGTQRSLLIGFFFRISKVDFSPILRADFDDIKTVCAPEWCPSTVLMSSKSVAKIGEKSPFEIRQKEHVLKTALCSISPSL